MLNLKQAGISILLALAVSPAFADDPSVVNHTYVKWGTPGLDKTDLQVGATTQATPGGDVQVTGTISGAYRQFELDRGAPYPGDPQKNEFDDFGGNLGLALGRDKNTGTVGGVFGNERVVAGHLYNLNAAHRLSLYLGGTESMGGQLYGNVDPRSNNYGAVLGPSMGVFYNAGAALALYFGPTALVAGRIQGSADGNGVNLGYGAGLGGTAGIFTKTDAVRADFSRLFWNDHSSPYAAKLEYERVINPSAVDDINWQKTGMTRWAAGIDLSATQATGGVPASAAITPYIKAAF